MNPTLPPWYPHSIDQLLETAIRSNRVQPRIDTQVDERIGALPVGSLEPFERSVGLTEAEVDHGNPERGDESARGLGLKFLDDALGLVSLTRDGVHVPDVGTNNGVAREKFRTSSHLAQRLWVFTLLFVREAAVPVRETVIRIDLDGP